MTYLENIKYIAEHITDEEILCQIAEEASELAQAALKLKRTLSKSNPTPVTFAEAKDKFLEEYADIIVCFDVYEEKDGDKLFSSVEFISDRKASRWVTRLRQSQIKNDFREKKDDR